jgi:hypothetical protein
MTVKSVPAAPPPPPSEMRRFELEQAAAPAGAALVGVTGTGLEA